jgi:hypothetical protein
MFMASIVSLSIFQPFMLSRLSSVDLGLQLAVWSCFILDQGSTSTSPPFARRPVHGNRIQGEPRSLPSPRVSPVNQLQAANGCQSCHMNNAAALSDRRHPNAQGLTDGTATLARTNQSDQGNFPGSEPVFSREKAYPATTWTPESSLTGKVLTYFPCAQSHRPTFVEQIARTARYPGFGRGRPSRRSRRSRHSPAHLPCRYGGNNE